jgi:ketosteroid isomerase-like protein
MKANNQDELQVRELCDRVASGIRTKNLDQVMAAYAGNVIQYDARAPLAHNGVGEVRKAMREWFDGYEGSIQLEIRDLTIATGGDIAFARSFNRVVGTLKDGQRVDMWVRWTGCCRRTDGAWKVVHEHVSVPFDPRTMRAELGLEP